MAEEEQELGSRLEEGGATLLRLSNEMVRAQKRFFGKGPMKAKSYIVDDMLFIVMRGGFTTAEKTMLDFGQQDKVRDFRQTFENEMTERLTDMVEQITGRRVLTYQSQILFEPDVVIEMFVFDQTATVEARAATSVGQLEDEATGEADDRSALDPPAADNEQ
ncbi:MAG: DUF2294 domain-containing protein [Solirubrobacteraceae bacterium]